MAEPPGPLVGCITALGCAWERSIQVTEKYIPGTFSEEIARKSGTNSNDTPPCNKLQKVCDYLYLCRVRRGFFIRTR